MADVAAPAPEEGLAASVSYMVRHFLEEKHYQTLHQTLSQSWNRLHSLSAAMKLMESYGVVLKPEEVDRLREMDEMQQINALVTKMPQQSNDQFQHFFLQLQLIVSTATRVRRALEDGRADLVEEALNEAESTGIAPYILKMAVVQAGSEVANLKRDFSDWIKATDSKMSGLIRGQEDLMSAQKKLATAQTQLSTFTTGQNEKAKKLLMGFASGNTRVLLNGCLHGWADFTKHAKHEALIRAEYEDRIQAAEGRLIEYKSSQLNNVRGVLLKQAAAKDTELLQEVWNVLKDNFLEAKWAIENADKIKELEDKLAAIKAAQKDGNLKVMMRMSAGNDTNLMTVCWQGWLSFSAEYKRDREMEEQVKESEKRVADFLKGKSDSAKQLLSSVSAATDSGLIQSVMQAWIQLWQEQVQEREMAEILNGAHGKFASFGERNSKSAKSVMERARLHLESMMCIRVYTAWRLDMKTEKAVRAFGAKVDAKKNQLVHVQQMFRNFAQQLEASLKTSEDSSRELRDNPHGRAHQFQSRMRRSNEGSVSLPDIHSKHSVPTSGGAPGGGGTNRSRVTSQRSPKGQDNAARGYGGGGGGGGPPPVRAAWEG